MADTEPEEWRAKGAPYELGYCQSAFSPATIIIGPFGTKELVDAVLPMLNTSKNTRPRWYVAKHGEIDRQHDAIVMLPSVDMMHLAIEVQAVRALDVQSLLGSKYVTEPPEKEEQAT